MNENPEEPEGCAGAAGAGGFAPKVNTPGLFGKLKLEVLLPNWNTEPGKMGLKQKAVRKLKFEFILSSKILMFFPLSLMIFSFFAGHSRQRSWGRGHTRSARLLQEQCIEEFIHFNRES